MSAFRAALLFFLAVASTAHAQERRGYLTGVCQTNFGPAQVNLTFVQYQTGAVFQDRNQLTAEAINTGYGLPWWQGTVQTAQIVYDVEGQGAFLEFRPRSGRYSDWIQMQLVGPQNGQFQFIENNNGQTYVYNCAMR